MPWEGVWGPPVPSGMQRIEWRVMERRVGEGDMPIRSEGRIRALARSLCLVLFACSLAWAGTSTVKITDGVTGIGESTSVEVRLDTTDAVQGWSLGVCHDPEELELLGATPGVTVDAMNDGSGPAFIQINEEEGGVTYGVVICFALCETLGPGTNYSLLDMNYMAMAPTGTVATLDFCDTLGEPPIVTVLTVEENSIAPEQESGSITVQSNSAFSIDQVFSGAGLQTTVPIRLSNTVALSGVQIACAYDPTHLFLVEAIPVGPTLDSDFFSLQEAVNPGEIGIGIIQDLGPTQSAMIPPGGDVSIVELDFFVSPTCPAPATLAVGFVPSVGTPALANRVVAGELQDTPQLLSGGIDILEEASFRRSDCNEDLIFDIADAIYLLRYLFVNGVTPNCLDACDYNDDGLLDAADTVSVFAYQFTDGAPPTAPFPDEGPDPTEDDLDCGGL